VIARAVTNPSFEVFGVARQKGGAASRETPTFGCDLTQEAGWTRALDGVDVVVHAAARVHVMADEANNPLREFRRVNVEGTLMIARKAIESGVRRFVFVSSIKVNGEETMPCHAFSPDDVPQPADPYGVSKYEAEEGLRRLADESGLEVAIIRPVLVYGPGVKANFLQMMRWISRGIPLPLASIRNRRSLVGLENLVDLIVKCSTHPAAANQTFLVSDGEDLSTPCLVRRVAQALGRPVGVVPFPPKLLHTVGRGIGKGDFVRRLCGSLQVDMTKTSEMLGWTPPVSVDQGLSATARAFLAEAAK